MGVITIKELLEAGVHFGHQTNRWNPKMKRYIFGERNGIYIIDLQQTLARFEAAYDFVRQTIAQGDSALFVGTKRQTSTIVEEEAKRCQMFNVSQRWLGGMLTNFNPDGIDYPIPGKDDAIRSVKFITSKIADAVIEGLHLRAQRAEEEKPGAMSPADSRAVQAAGAGV